MPIVRRRALCSGGDAYEAIPSVWPCWVVGEEEYWRWRQMRGVNAEGTLECLRADSRVRRGASARNEAEDDPILGNAAMIGDAQLA